MDGIGGLVIGNLFTINQDILPNGYKGTKGTGQKLAQTITGISHTVGNSDWTTKIDALNIVLGKGPNTIAFSSLKLATLIEESFKSSLQSQLPPSSFFDPNKLNPPPLFGGPCNAPYSDKAGNGGGTLTSKGWAGKQIPKVTTVIDPAVEGPKLKATYGKVLAQGILALAKTEQSFKAPNYNFGGFDITDGGWAYEPAYHAGYHVSLEGGGTGVCKAFASFKSFEAFAAKAEASFRAKGLDKADTADKFAELWLKKWNSGGIYTYPDPPYIGKINSTETISPAAVAWRAKIKANVMGYWNDMAKHVK
jgi:hypothetical protein